MGQICGKQPRRITPKSKTSNLGLQSGLTLNSQSVFQQSKLKQTDAVEPIYQLLLQEEEVVPWDDPKKIINEILKPQGYKYKTLIKSTFNTLSAEIVKVTTQEPHIFKRNLFQNFDQASNNISYLYNLNQVTTDGLVHFSSLSICIFDQSHLKVKQKNEVYAIDRIIPKYQNLQDQLEKGTNMETVIHSLVILDQISECLSSMHNENFAYRFLRPESVLHKDSRFYLSNPSFQLSPNEQKLIEFIVTKESEYYIYDAIMFSLLFLYLIEHENHSFDDLIERRMNETAWDEIITYYKEEVSKQFKNEVPQIIQQLIENITVFEKHSMPKMSEIYYQIRTCRQKGLQTNFKNDSLGAFLQYHKDVTLPKNSPWVYFTKANQIHVYNIETRKFHYLKIFKKKQPFKVESDVVYHPIDDKFFFFSHNKSTFLLKVYDETHEKDIISWRREVELFRDIKQIKFDEPQLIVIEENDTDSKMIVLNQLQQFDGDQDSYFTSLIIQFKYQDVENTELEEDEQMIMFETDKYIKRKCISIVQGPKNYQWRRYGFHFFDPHNKMLYCIPDFNNVFQNGIRYSYYDVAKNKGNFKDGLLRFTCSSEEMFKQFCRLNFRIKKVVFCVEVQHGVFIMQAAKNIFILDFNFKCFYSFASLNQLQNYEENKKKFPHQFQNIYEVRNQPFELKCIDSGGKNFVFQNGYLHCVAKKEIETVHCVYELFPNQGCVTLLQCVSLHSNQDLLSKIPKTIQDVLQEQQLQDSAVYRRVIKTVRNYNVTRHLFQDENEAFLSAEIEATKSKYYLHQVKAQNLKEITMLFEAFNSKFQSHFLLVPIEYFAAFEDKQYYMYYVGEEIISTLETDIEQRNVNQKIKNYFEPKEIALLIKIIFRMLKELRDFKIEHGNLSTNSLCLTKKGLFKVSGWYVANRQNFSSDLNDAMKVLFCLATLKTFNQVECIDPAAQELNAYEGLADFFQGFESNKTQNFDTLMSDALLLSKKLMITNLQFDDYDSKVQALIWVAYGDNYILVTPLENLKEPRFLKLRLLKENNAPFKISKHCMFTFNYYDTIYLVGAVREDLKSQKFYEIVYNKHKQNQMLYLKALPDIPYPVLSPSLLYCDNKVFSIGGYEYTSNVNKQITDKCFMYNIKTRQWKEIKSLPITVYGATALYCDFLKVIYLFGGVSNEVDLTVDSLVYLTYDITRDYWDINIDLSFKSPFMNSRFDKPMVDNVAPLMFVSYYKTDDGYFFIEIFELVKAGISLKYKIKDNTKLKDASTKEGAHKEGAHKEKEEPPKIVVVQNEKEQEFKRTLQDDLSMALYKDSLYVMDEDTNNLHIFRLKDPFHPQMDIIPCMIQENPLLIQRVHTDNV